jgi:hypothetical protein
MDLTIENSDNTTCLWASSSYTFAYKIDAYVQIHTTNHQKFNL